MRLPILAAVFAVVVGVFIATPAPAFLTGGPVIGDAAGTLSHVEQASHCRCLDKDCRRIECRSPIRGVPPGATDCQCVRSFFLLCTRQQCTSSSRSVAH